MEKQTEGDVKPLDRYLSPMDVWGIAMFALLVYSVLMWFVKHLSAADSIRQDRAGYGLLL